MSYIERDVSMAIEVLASFHRGEFGTVNYTDVHAKDVTENFIQETLMDMWMRTHVSTTHIVLSRSLIGFPKDNLPFVQTLGKYANYYQFRRGVLGKWGEILIFWESHSLFKEPVLPPNSLWIGAPAHLEQSCSFNVIKETVSEGLADQLSRDLASVSKYLDSTSQPGESGTSHPR